MTDHAAEAAAQEEHAKAELDIESETETWEMATRHLAAAQVHASLAISHRLAVIARDMPAGRAPGGGPR